MAARAGAVFVGRSEGFAEAGQHLLHWGRASRISRACKDPWPRAGQAARAVWLLAAPLRGAKGSLPSPASQV